ncbi:hypothetical protein Hanom_Chr12g01144261 [Helianthus anomalus]
MRVSIALTGFIVCFLFTCPNHFNLSSFILSDILVTHTYFFIQSNLVCPYIHLNIIISTTSILHACVFLMAQQFVPYNIVGVIVTQ